MNLQTLTSQYEVTLLNARWLQLNPQEGHMLVVQLNQLKCKGYNIPSFNSLKKMFKRSNLLANNLNAITKLKTLKENNKLHSQQCKVHNNHRPIKIIDMQKKVKHDLQSSWKNKKPQRNPEMTEMMNEDKKEARTK